MPVISQKPALPVLDRRFYGWSAVTVPVIVLVGFARTYYLKGFFGTRALTPFVKQAAEREVAAHSIGPFHFRLGINFTNLFAFGALFVAAFRHQSVR